MDGVEQDMSEKSRKGFWKKLRVNGEEWGKLSDKIKGLYRIHMMIIGDSENVGKFMLNIYKHSWDSIFLNVLENYIKAEKNKCPGIFP